MEATDLQIKGLDSRMKELEEKIDALTHAMGEVKDELKKVSRGLYGDEDNATLGLIARQIKDEERLRELETKVLALEKNFKEGLIKKKTTNEFVDKLKKWAIILGVVFLIAKEFIGLDSLGNLIQLFLK